ncbi:MAG: epoxyqueuosine reductase QueH [Clostridiales bacterium]|nr:epoxyqueuosine reductase QueH [Clostridiales bacterium]
MKNERGGKPALLLHSCCGPCSTSVVESLAPQYDITVYFYNPNITDRAEYDKRLENQQRFIDAYNNSRADQPGKIALVLGEYEPLRFYGEARGLENEREGGERCRACIRMRLEKTAQAASLGGFGGFATTLSVSPHKSYPMISQAGQELSVQYGVDFADWDHKKNGGYQRSLELSREYSLYRQNYCGCEYSRGEKGEK